MTFAVLGAASAPGWSLDPAAMAAAAFICTGYAVRVRTLRRARRPVPVARQAAFYLGIGILLGALVSPIDGIGEERVFYVHMVQHLIIGDLAALAIVIGLSGPILRPVLALPLVSQLRRLAHPVIALALWTLVLYAWHLPALYQAALEHPAVHALEHLSFLSAGVLIWAAVIEPLPGPVWFGTGAKAAYVLVVRTLGAVLATVFIWAGSPLYPHYAAGERLWGISPLRDQTIGGAIMFTEGAIVTLAVFAWLFVRWMRDAELRQGLLESGHDPNVSRRAARYGRRALDPVGGEPGGSAPLGGGR